MSLAPPAILLLLATCLPLASFAILTCVGRRMGEPLAGIVAAAFVGASFVCSLIAMILWVSASGEHSTWGFQILPIDLSFRWLPIGIAPGQRHAGYLDLGIFIDSLTIVMFAMVSLVATLVSIFSLAYMRGDRRFARYFTHVSLFVFSMLGLLISGSLLQLFIFWELVGLCSYLLIGFWFDRKTAANAAIKAFLVNRIGDAAFMIGLGILVYHAGNLNFVELWSQLGPRASTTLAPAWLNVAGICLFLGAAGKSAQFPLHVWLPDAMEGPTPISALIHAATMVAAGVYLVGRMFPLFTADVKLFIAIIGCVTLTMAALIAVAQTDIKRVLAFSTISQLGYMILALGIGSWIGGLFHLMTHAFFKALLFLGAGSVIRAAHHEQELPQMGGLLKKIPVTAATFGVGVLAISGTPFFAGYYSKDLILAHAGAFGSLAAAAHRSNLYWLLFALPTAVAYLTAFYMTRCWMLAFWGKPRNRDLHEKAAEEPTLWIPLLSLAVLSIIGGKFLGVRDFLDAAYLEDQKSCAIVDPKSLAFTTAWPDEPRGALASIDEPLEASAAPAAASTGRGESLTRVWANWAWLVGIAGGFILYIRGFAIVAPIVRILPIRWIHIWLYRRMYFDELYFSVPVAITNALIAACGWFDRLVIDGLINLIGICARRISDVVGWADDRVIDGGVLGIAGAARGAAAAASASQSGRIRLYATALIAAVTLCLGGAVIVVMMH